VAVAAARRGMIDTTSSPAMWKDLKDARYPVSNRLSKALGAHKRRK
jgi:hypothetical protein